MSTPTATTESLEVRVKRLEQEKAALEQELRALRLEQSISLAASTPLAHSTNGEGAKNDLQGVPSLPAFTPFEKVAALTNPEIARYGRQLILPGFGIQGKF